MLWKEVKRWAKDHGFECSKQEDHYSWNKASDPSVNGIEKSVSRLAKAIYNQITEGKWKEHQDNYGIS